jgi:hypothetical protein
LLKSLADEGRGISKTILQVTENFVREDWAESLSGELDTTQFGWIW